MPEAADAIEAAGRFIREGATEPGRVPGCRRPVADAACLYGDGIPYRHLLVVYDRTSEGDEAIVAAGLLAERDRARLTIVVVVELERPQRWVMRWPRGTGVWNDVLLDRARADLQQAARLASVPAELTVLFGKPDRALPEAADEFDCDAIVLPPRPRGRLRRLLRRDRAGAIRGRTSCEVVQPR